MNHLTLCLVIRDGRMLLGMKKRGFGAGKWNGFGGKLTDGESAETAARRELFEEALISAQDLEPAGDLLFHFDNSPDALAVHLFRVTRFLSEPTETDEMRPAWFSIAEIPYDRMWADDRHWLPLVLRGETVTGVFRFADEERLVGFHIASPTTRQAFILGGRYRHYKGSLYDVSGIGQHTENQEACVIYHPTDETKRTWLRPINSFLEPVTVADTITPRFQLIAKQ